MWTVVVVSNLVIGLLCLLAAWQLWHLKRRLARAADTLLAFERSVQRVLERAPDTIYKKHAGIQQLRATYQGLEPQWQRAQKALSLLSLGQSLWQRRLMFLAPRPRSTRQATRRSL
jgi:hypothetical protein